MFHYKRNKTLWEPINCRTCIVGQILLSLIKCIAFHFSRLHVCAVSILSQLSYESSHPRSVRIQFRDWSVSRNHFAYPRSYKNLQSTCDIQSIGFKGVFGSYSLCLRPFCRRVFCVHLHDLHKRIKTFEGCILNVWKCIHKEAIQVKNYYHIALLALEWGGGWSMIKRVI